MRPKCLLCTAFAPQLAVAKLQYLFAGELSLGGSNFGNKGAVALAAAAAEFDFASVIIRTHEYYKNKDDKLKLVDQFDHSSSSQSSSKLPSKRIAKISSAIIFPSAS